MEESGRRACSDTYNGQDATALNWYSQAYDNNYGADALKGFAYTLKKLERYPV
jgi:hypothetical protein